MAKILFFTPAEGRGGTEQKNIFFHTMEGHYIILLCGLLLVGGLCLEAFLMYTDYITPISAKVKRYVLKEHMVPRIMRIQKLVLEMDGTHSDGGVTEEEYGPPRTEYSWEEDGDVFHVVDYLQFIQDKRVQVNGYRTIKCNEYANQTIAYYVELDISNRKNIWRLSNQHGPVYASLKAISNVVLNACSFVFIPFLIFGDGAFTFANFCIHILECVLNLFIFIIMFVVSLVYSEGKERPPTFDVRRILNFLGFY